MEDYQRRYSARLDQLATGSRERTRRDLEELVGALPPDAVAGPPPSNDQIDAEFAYAPFASLSGSAAEYGRKLDELASASTLRRDSWLLNPAPSAGYDFISDDDTLTADCARVDLSFCERYLPPGTRWPSPRVHLCHTRNEFVDQVIRDLRCSNTVAVRQTIGERGTLTTPDSGTLINVAGLNLAADPAAWNDDVRMRVIGDLARGRIGRGLFWSRTRLGAAHLARGAWRQDLLNEVGVANEAPYGSGAEHFELISAASAFPVRGWLELTNERIVQQLGIRPSRTFTSIAGVVKEALRLAQQVVLDGVVRDMIGASLPVIAISNVIVGVFKIAFLASRGDVVQAKVLHENMKTLRLVANAARAIKGFDLAGWLGKWLLMSIETRQGSSASPLEAVAWTVTPTDKLIALSVDDCAERLKSQPLSCPDTRLLALTQLREKGNLTRLAEAQWGFLEK